MSINVSSATTIPVESLLTGSNKKTTNDDFTEALVAKQDLQKSDIATDKVSLSNQSLAMAQANSASPEERLNDYIQNGGNLQSSSSSSTSTLSEANLRKIAEESLAFSRKMGMTEDSTVEEVMYSIKKYALPPWYSDYAVEYVNNSYSERQASLAKFNQLSNNDQSYYGEQIASIYQSVLENNNLSNDVNQRYNDLYYDKTASARIHQEMTDRIKQDPKLVDIFQKVGKASVLA